MIHYYTISVRAEKMSKFNILFPIVDFFLLFFCLLTFLKMLDPYCQPRSCPLPLRPPRALHRCAASQEPGYTRNSPWKLRKLIQFLHRSSSFSGSWRKVSEFYFSQSWPSGASGVRRALEVWYVSWVKELQRQQFRILSASKFLVLLGRKVDSEVD